MVKDNISAYNSQLTQQERAEHASKAGQASAKARIERKSLSQIVCAWGDGEITDKEQIKQLKALGVKELTNKSTLILALLKNVNERGDTKSLQMLTEMLMEDRKREKEIEKLKAEIERIELEKEKLRKEISGELTENKITIISNIPTSFDETGGNESSDGNGTNN